ncbi:wolframin ER transmembrane glycoprotein wfs1 isoform X1 [Andrena cerasifolii]|uniref:wolframin ER transmembrane glycoprotein wfs1 isoform X1 n=1 Tax=Andrena cerasifolii TaxID=2819439 RepID=UPI004037D589
MAGVVPLSGRSGRKQWTLHDGPRGSLRRLRSQLAEDGCPESQVVLAKQLLEERCDLDVDKEENAKLGVYWLTKASEQGNLEATVILRKCLATGRGITEHNYYDVKSCLDMTQNEKLARRAAREMFTSLSNGEDFITTEQLQRRMRDLATSSSNNISCSHSNNVSHSKVQKNVHDISTDNFPKNGLPDDAAPKKDEEEKESDIHDWMDHQGEKITEAALVSAAASYARGMLPIVSHALCMIDPAQMALDTIPLLQRPLIHPLASLKRLYIWLIETLGQRGMSIRKFLFTSNIHILLLLLLYSLFGTESLILFIPMALYYLSFVVMVITTFQMLQRKREFNNFRVWSGLFLNYSSGNLNPKKAEYQFCCNNLKPYGHFFLALLLNLMIYPVIAHQWTPQSEFTIIAIALTLVTLLNFMWKDSSRVPDFLALFSFGVHVLAKYPYETDMVVAQGWRFLDIRVPTFASYVVGNGIEFCLNFRAVFYLLIPAVFAKMAARDNWRGTYQTLIPHCVTLSWWQIAIFSSQGATWYGLIRGALALVGMVLFLPLAGLASIILPIVATAKYLSESDLAMRIAVTALLGGMPFLASWYLRKTRTPKFNWIITVVQLTMGIAAGMFLSWPMIMEYKQESDRYEGISALSWEQYQNHCHQPAWEELLSKAQVQIQCADLEGILVSWEGYVTNIKLKSIRNSIATVFNKLPDSIENLASCTYGEPYLNNCDSGDKLRQKNCKHFASIQKRKNKCHFPAWNRYEFEISVKMKSSIWGNNAEILLVADHSFTNVSLNIYPGDKIWFSGTLLNDGLEEESLLGGSKPQIELEEMGCLACHSIDLKSYKRYRYHMTFRSVLSDLYLGLKTVLNFLLNPIVMFK